MDQNQQESFFSLLKVAAKQKQVFVEKDTIYVKGEETVQISKEWLFRGVLHLDFEINC